MSLKGMGVPVLSFLSLAFTLRNTAMSSEHNKNNFVFMMCNDIKDLTGRVLVVCVLQIYEKKLNNPNITSVTIAWNDVFICL